MSKEDSSDSVSRRAALKIIAGSAGAAVRLPALGTATRPGAAAACQQSPAARSAASGAAKFFTAAEMQTLGSLSETIIPADEHSPGAQAARVNEYIDEIISDANERTKNLWREGIAGVDAMAKSQGGKAFAECTAEQQIALLETISRNEERPVSLEEKFFVALKRAAVDGYYTSSIGIHQELEYQGNTALAEFKGCTHPEHRSLPREEVPRKD
jgi:glucoside 3-dehydrogenase (cytochrome c) hitch-hiker subunit